MNLWTKFQLWMSPPKHKYIPGQLCLVIGGPHTLWIGRKVILGRKRDADHQGKIAAYWSTDPLIRSPLANNYFLLFREDQLLPLDDPDLNAEIRKEKNEDKIPSRWRIIDVEMPWQKSKETL